MIQGNQVLVPDVPNKIYIQVKSKFLENKKPIFEPVEFSKVNLVHLRTGCDQEDLKEMVLENIMHVHDGRASFTFTPVYDLNCTHTYSLEVFHAYVKIVEK
jgi:hypothetical protein